MMITDEILAQAAAELATAINKSLPDPTECEHQFSAEFEKKIKKLNRKSNHPIIFRILRSASVVLLIITIGFGSILTLSTDTRATVFGWIKEHYKSFYKYSFDGEATTSDTSKYSLGYIPEGFIFKTSYEVADGEAYVYFGSDDKMIQFVYSHAMNSASFFIERAGYDIKHVTIGNSQGDLYITTDKAKTNGIVWTNDEDMIFCVSAPLEAKDLIKMAEKIIKNSTSQ